MNVSEILKIPLYKIRNISESELRKMTSALASTANKRLSRLTTSVQVGDAMHYAFSTGGRFGIGRSIAYATEQEKPTSKEDVYEEFKRTRTFLKFEDSTVTGYQRKLNREREYLRQLGIEADEETINRANDAFRELVERDPQYDNARDKYRIMQEFYRALESDKNADLYEIVDRIVENGLKYRKKEEESEREVSDFFRI